MLSMLLTVDKKNACHGRKYRYDFSVIKTFNYFRKLVFVDIWLDLGEGRTGCAWRPGRLPAWRLILVLFSGNPVRTVVKSVGTVDTHISWFWTSFGSILDFLDICFIVCLFLRVQENMFGQVLTSGKICGYKYSLTLSLEFGLIVCL